MAAGGVVVGGDAVLRVALMVQRSWFVSPVTMLGSRPWASAAGPKLLRVKVSFNSHYRNCCPGPGKGQMSVDFRPGVITPDLRPAVAGD